jgi:predicted Zn-dependent protease
MTRRSTPVLLALGILVAACATNPVTGKRELSFLSEGQEIQLGAQSDEAIVAQYGLVEDPALASYVQSIGERMVPVSHRWNLEFHFRLLDDAVVNAFALPGGYVYITRGIMAYLSDEAALAGVMGHEIGHVAARHGAQHYTEQALFGLGLGLGSALSETFARYAGVAATATQLLLLKYSRDDERQADQLGVEYATKLGYDTKEMAEFFHTLDQLSAGSGRLPSWASTHPDPGERYQKVLALTTQWQTQAHAGPYEADRDRYLRHLEGVVFGQNPRQGFVENGMFVHPDMRFQFPVPSRWKVSNTNTQVVLASPQQDAAVIFTVAQGTSLEEAVQTFASQEGIQAGARQGLQISGWPAIRVESTVTGGSTEQRVVSTFVQRDGTIFVFHGLTDAASYAGQQLVLRQPADGFAPLIDPQALAIRPIVLHVVEAPATETFAAVVARYPIPEGADIDIEGLALVNGTTPDAQVRKGQLVKMLRRAPTGS